MSKKAAIEFTLAELEQLDLCLRNGYGDGDWEEYLNNKTASNTLGRAWDKLTDAKRRLRQPTDKKKHLNTT